MSKFHSVKVKSIQRQTKDAVAITLDIPHDLKESFAYVPGQYITFRVNIAGESLNRSYSLCSAPSLAEDPSVAVKEVKGGKVSSFFNRSLKAGDSLEIMPPMGNFKADPSSDDKQHYILFGGGSGITPLFSILKSVLHQAKDAKVSLFYANYNSESVIFKQELLDLKTKFGTRFSLVHIFDKPNKSGGFLGFGKKNAEELEFEEGMLTGKMCLDLLKKYTDLNFRDSQFYMCGPGGLMDNVGSALSQLQIPQERVHREYFSEKSDTEKQSASVGQADVNFSGKSKVEIIYDGASYNLEMDSKETILDAALDANVDPPFACMVGACTTCRAKLVEGSAKMKDSQALTQKEIEAGFILTCQAHPTSEIVKINYDE
ncbi:MAG: 2Fe-2S iron-sulfur cluster binding domain-containing protein [Chitinophagales bacterium]|nr:2Fe-2S iron-sulfur cluster binding domain-containing protein [Chitinophagales bacterium]